MSAPVFSAPHFNDEDAARRHLEAVRWPNGPICPHCGSVNRAYATKGRPGKYRCAEKECRKDFTATVGTLFERSHIPLTTWFRAIHLLCSSKKGMSSHQMHRMLGVTYKTAWFMTHRIREAMRAGMTALKMGGGGGIVEVDETFIGQKKGVPKRRGYAHKHAVLTLTERGGETRSFHVDGTKASDLVPILKANIAKEARIMTDEAGQYAHLNKEFASHEFVSHGAGEYVRGEAHTNTAENFYSVFKRGMKGVYQHCGEQHLHRYVAEFDFRYNNRSALGVGDVERSTKALRGIAGKRLTYRGPAETQA